MGTYWAVSGQTILPVMECKDGREPFVDSGGRLFSILAVRAAAVWKDTAPFAPYSRLSPSASGGVLCSWNKSGIAPFPALSYRPDCPNTRRALSKPHGGLGKTREENTKHRARCMLPVAPRYDSGSFLQVGTRLTRLQQPAEGKPSGHPRAFGASLLTLAKAGRKKRRR